MRFEFLPAFKGDCFLIQAGSEAAPFLILVDGGPAGTYRTHLRKRLVALRENRGLDETRPLRINLVIVSHVDDDHINGIIDLFTEIRDARRAGDLPLFEVEALWHNSFDAILGNDEVAAEIAQFGAASFAPLVAESDSPEAFDAGLILQSIQQGQDLRDLAEALGIEINPGFDGLVRTRAGEATRRRIGGIDVTIIGPRESELRKLQKDHDKWLAKRRAAGEPVTPASLLQALTDESVANLSSIVLLVERDGQSALLTGDARSDFILSGLEESGLVDPGGSIEIGLLKMPHHGSDRNVDEDFLRRIPARRYLFSGDGEHGNPERATFEMLLAARPAAPMDWYLTYSAEEIDAERQRDHDKEREKELKKQRDGKRIKPGQPRPPWDADAHAVATLVGQLPPNVRVHEPDGPVILD